MGKWTKSPEEGEECSNDKAVRKDVKESTAQKLSGAGNGGLGKDDGRREEGMMMEGRRQSTKWKRKKKYVESRERSFLEH